MLEHVNAKTVLRMVTVTIMQMFLHAIKPETQNLQSLLPGPESNKNPNRGTVNQAKSETTVTVVSSGLI